jgi:acetolactate synthase-1/2/3 large subunit
MQKAFEHLIGGRPGPVMLEFTIESLKAEVDATIPDKFTFSKKEPQEEAILEIAKIINNSHKPFIIAGREVFALKAEKELSEFAKAIAAPIITTCMGKGVVSDFEDYSLGSILNINYYKKMESLAQESDLCIAIGNRFTQVDTDNWSMKLPKTLVSITIDDSFINKDYTSDYSLTGNIKSNLQLLLSNLEKKELNLDWNNFVTNFKKQIGDISFPKIVSDIRATLNRDGILVNDVHSEGFPTCGHFKVYEPSNYIQSAISLGVGYALPAAIGAKIAFPDRQVIAFSGDGGFLMSSPDFSTAMKYGINVVFVIVNDNAFGTIKKGQPEHLHDTIGLDLYNPDFMDFAKAYKAKSFRVNDLSDFRLVLKKALEMNEPVIIEVVKKNNQI